MIIYDENAWLLQLLWRRRGSAAPKALPFALFSAALAIVFGFLDEWAPGFRHNMGMDQITQGHAWSAIVFVTSMLLGFRTNRAYSRFWEGTGLLHQMSGEWFDSVSCLMAFSRPAMRTKPTETRDFRHTLARLVSLMHGSAMEEIAAEDPDAEPYPVIDIQGLDHATLNWLKTCKEDKYGFDRVQVLIHLTQNLMTQALEDGVLKIPPPILSRVYQTLSRGLVNLLNAKKIKDTLFPFPYAQLIVFLLFMNTFIMPVMISAIIETKLWGAIITFIPVFGLFSLNFVARELEMPFGNDANDLPLAHFQAEMNRSILMLLHEKADILPRTSSHCVRNVEELLKTTFGLAEDEFHASVSRNRTTVVSNALSCAEDDDEDSDEEPGKQGMKSPGKAVTPPAAPTSLNPSAAPPKLLLDPKQEELRILSKPDCPPPDKPGGSSLEQSMNELRHRVQILTNKAEDQTRAVARNTEAMMGFNQTIHGLSSQQMVVAWSGIASMPQAYRSPDGAPGPFPIAL